MIYSSLNFNRDQKHVEVIQYSYLNYAQTLGFQNSYQDCKKLGYQLVHERNWLTKAGLRTQILDLQKLMAFDIKLSARTAEKLYNNKKALNLILKKMKNFQRMDQIILTIQTE